MIGFHTSRTRRVATTVGAAFIAALLLASCADPDVDMDSEPGTAAASSTARSTVTPPEASSSEAPSDPSPSEVGTAGEASTRESGGAVPSVDPAVPVSVRQYDVDGAVVTTRSAVEELPERASVVRFSAKLIDEGDGLELCIGGSEDSLPPQCEGPVVVGLDPEGWTETQAGVTWGERAVVLEWPPVDGQLTLVADGPPNYPGPGEVQVEEPEGSYDLAQLEAITDLISDAGLFGAAGPVTYTAIGAVPGRLDVGLVVADLATIRRVLDVVDTPDALHLWGEAEVLR